MPSSAQTWITLKEKQIDEIYIVGVCTNICVYIRQQMRETWVIR